MDRLNPHKHQKYFNTFHSSLSVQCMQQVDLCKPALVRWSAVDAVAEVCQYQPFVRQTAIKISLNPYIIKYKFLYVRSESRDLWRAAQRIDEFKRSQTFAALSLCETPIEGDEKGELRIARYRQPELWLSAYPTRHLEQMRLRRTSNDCHVGGSLVRSLPAASRILSINSSRFGMLEREVLLVI